MSDKIGDQVSSDKAYAKFAEVEDVFFATVELSYIVEVAVRAYNEVNAQVVIQKMANENKLPVRPASSVRITNLVSPSLNKVGVGTSFDIEQEES